MNKRNTATWLRKREVANMMQIDMQAVTDYWKQGLLPGKQLFGGRIILFNKRDVEAFMATLAQEKEHPEEHEHSGSSKHKEKH